MKLDIYLNKNYNIEKEYVLSVIFEDILGCECTFYYLDNLTNYKIVFSNNKEIIINDIFFESLDGFSWEEVDFPSSSFESNISINDNHSLFGIYGNDSCEVNDKSIKILNDIIGTTFIFLSRVEEFQHNHDQLGRYQYKGSLAEHYNILNRPIVNEYISFIKECIIHLFPDAIFKKMNYKVMLTHDIDTVKRWTFKHFLKHTIFNFGSKKYFPGFKSFFESKYQTIDPYMNFNQIMKLSDKHNLQSIFLFMALENEDNEFLYDINDMKTDINKIKENKNHFVGIHPGKSTYNCNESMRSEIDRLKKIVKEEILYSRQHFLMFDIKNTWRLLNDNKIKYDLTLGYPEKIGFRCGICYPYKVFDFSKRKKLDLIEIPLIIMDVTLTKYMNEYTYSNLIDELKFVINYVKKYDGILNIIWHNNSFYDYKNSKYEKLFFDIISLSKKNDYLKFN
jgi:hypothetical protein